MTKASVMPTSSPPASRRMRLSSAYLAATSGSRRLRRSIHDLKVSGCGVSSKTISLCYQSNGSRHRFVPLRAAVFLATIDVISSSAAVDGADPRASIRTGAVASRWLRLAHARRIIVPGAESVETRDRVSLAR